MSHKLQSLLVEKGETVWRDQLCSVREFPVDDNVCQRFLERQKEVSGEDSLVARVLERLTKSIRRVSREEIFEGIEYLAGDVWDKLKESNDTRFYVALSGDKSDVCFSKSTVFVSTMMMARHKQLAASFRGFLCLGQLLEDVDSDTTNPVQHIVYADDGSFSGSQLTDGIKAVHTYSPAAEQTTLHIAILFISPRTQQRVEENIPTFGQTHWYTLPNQKQPQPVIESLRRLPGENVLDIAHKFLDHADLFSRNRDNVLGKPLFYTDLKMPDQMSAHPHFLLDPQLLYPEGKSPFGESLVFGCKPPNDSDSTRKMMAGIMCPVPCYKKVRWLEHVIEIGEHGVKRKRKL